MNVDLPAVFGIGVLIAFLIGKQSQIKIVRPRELRCARACDQNMGGVQQYCLRDIDRVTDTFDTTYGAKCPVARHA